MKSFFLALGFLTIIPVGKVFGARDDKELAKSVRCFPLAGATIGLLLIVADFILRPFFSEFIVSLFILIVLITATGALHLDGFIDSIDGLFSGRDKKRMLEIMLDSRAGAFGTIAVICLLLLKFSFLNEIQSDIRYFALIFMPIISRWAAVYAIYKYPHAETKGAGEIFANLVNFKDFILATLFTLFLAAILLRFNGLIIWSIIFIILFLLTKWINKKLGGLTGDIYGGLIEITEIVILILVYLLY